MTLNYNSLILILSALMAITGCSSHQSSYFDKQMIRIASDFNQSCPIMINEDTRLDNTMFLPNKTFIFNYTLININIANLDTNDFNKNFRLDFLNVLKTSPEFQIFRDQKFKITLNYLDMNKVFVTRFIFLPEEYQQDLPQSVTL